MEKNLLTIKSPLWRKTLLVLFFGLAFLLSVPLVVHSVDSLKKAHRLLDDPNSGFIVSDPQAVYSGMRQEIAIDILLVVLFGLTTIASIYSPRTILILDEESLTPYSFLKSRRVRILLSDIDRISPVIQTTRGYGRFPITFHYKYLGIYLKNEARAKYQNKKISKYLMSSLGLNGTMSDNNTADFYIPLSGLSEEWVMQQIRPYVKT